MISISDRLMSNSSQADEGAGVDKPAFLVEQASCAWVKHTLVQHRMRLVEIVS